MGNKFKNDAYRKHRGGHSRWLLVSCESCGNDLLVYQKDGPGMLKRMYLDRIASSAVRTKGNLVCEKCETLLGTPMTYKKESRPAIRLYVGAVTKKIIDAESAKRFIKKFEEK